MAWMATFTFDVTSRFVDAKYNIGRLNLLLPKRFHKIAIAKIIYSDQRYVDKLFDQFFYIAYEIQFWKLKLVESEEHNLIEAYPIIEQLQS